MTRKTLLTIPATLLVLAAGPVMAQDTMVDVNGDGMVSFPELQAVLTEMTEEEFTILDVTGDGLLDADEIAAGTEAGLLPEDAGLLPATEG